MERCAGWSVACVVLAVAPGADGDGCPCGRRAPDALDERTTDTWPVWCGDGVVDAGEQCDDGNHVDGDGCAPDCTYSVVCEGERCVQGSGSTTGGGETTSDVTGGVVESAGTSSSSGACDSQCEGSSCDDMCGSTGCSTDCAQVVCGDGVIGGDEECDDGEDGNDDRNGPCSAKCEAVRRFVFITSTMPVMMGVAESSGYCDTLAQTRETLRGRRFAAWLSDASSAPGMSTEFTDFRGIYVDVHGALIAEGWLGLTAEDADPLIEVDETGKSVDASDTVRTGTTPQGGLTPPEEGKNLHCDNWSVPDVERKAGAGVVNPNGIDGISWTSGKKVVCSALSLKGARLYCFEVSK